MDGDAVLVHVFTRLDIGGFVSTVGVSDGAMRGKRSLQRCGLRYVVRDRRNYYFGEVRVRAMLAHGATADGRPSADGHAFLSYSHRWMRYIGSIATHMGERRNRVRHEPIACAICRSGATATGTPDRPAPVSTTYDLQHDPATRWSWWEPPLLFLFWMLSITALTLTVIAWRKPPDACCSG